MSPASGGTIHIGLTGSSDQGHAISSAACSGAHMHDRARPAQNTTRANPKWCCACCAANATRVMGMKAKPALLVGWRSSLSTLLLCSAAYKKQASKQQQRIEVMGASQQAAAHTLMQFS
jgi:hypothetical protein